MHACSWRCTHLQQQAQLLEQINSLVGAFAVERVQSMHTLAQSVQSQLGSHAQATATDAQGIASSGVSAVSALQVSEEGGLVCEGCFLECALQETLGSYQVQRCCVVVLQFGTKLIPKSAIQQCFNQCASCPNALTLQPQVISGTICFTEHRYFCIYLFFTNIQLRGNQTFAQDGWSTYFSHLCDKPTQSPLNPLRYYRFPGCRDHHSGPAGPQQPTGARRHRLVCCSSILGGRQRLTSCTTHPAAPQCPGLLAGGTYQGL